MVLSLAASRAQNMRKTVTFAPQNRFYLKVTDNNVFLGVPNNTNTWEDFFWAEPDEAFAWGMCYTQVTFRHFVVKLGDLCIAHTSGNCFVWFCSKNVFSCVGDVRYPKKPLISVTLGAKVTFFRIFWAPEAARDKTMATSIWAKVTWDTCKDFRSVGS